VAKNVSVAAKLKERTSVILSAQPAIHCLRMITWFPAATTRVPVRWTLMSHHKIIMVSK